MREINIDFKVQGDSRVHQVPAPFQISGDNRENMTASYVPQKITPQELTSRMVRAYWEFNCFEESDLYEEELEKMTARVNKLATNP